MRSLSYCSFDGGVARSCFRDAVFWVLVYLSHMVDRLHHISVTNNHSQVYKYSLPRSETPGHGDGHHSQSRFPILIYGQIHPRHSRPSCPDCVSAGLRLRPILHFHDSKKKNQVSFNYDVMLFLHLPSESFYSFGHATHPA